MQKKKPKTRCERRQLKKAEGVCRFYSKVQSAYADMLSEDENIVEIRCNVLLDGLDYTSDFLCKKADGTYMVRECVNRKTLTWNSTVKLLDASLDYWRRHGITDWGIVIEKEESNAAEE